MKTAVNMWHGVAFGCLRCAPAPAHDLVFTFSMVFGLKRENRINYRTMARMAMPRDRHIHSHPTPKDLPENRTSLFPLNSHPASVTPSATISESRRILLPTTPASPSSSCRRPDSSAREIAVGCIRQDWRPLEWNELPAV